MHMTLAKLAHTQCPVATLHRRRRCSCRHQRAAPPVSTRSGLREEVDQLNIGKSPVEELSGETNTMVTDVMDIDRTPELLAWVFSGLFGRSSKQQQQPQSSPDQAPSSSPATAQPPPSTSSADQPTISDAPSQPSQPPADSAALSSSTPASATASAPTSSPASSPALELATLGGGCFWCIEACLRELAGVVSVTSGYAGGQLANPTYQQICSGTTGHAEVVQISYDPAVLPYEDLLRVFFTLHDPTTPNRSGNDVGPQYRSIILTHNERQAEAARGVIAEVGRGLWFPGARVVTEVAPLRQFYTAESYHQRYYSRNPGAGYCAFVVRPKLQEFRRKYAKRLRKDEDDAEPL